MAKAHLYKKINIEVIDGDEYRKVLCADLGFSKADRNTNIRRLAFVASRLAAYDVVPVICAINPYEEIRSEIVSQYPFVRTVYIKCAMEELIRRDTKGMYARAMLPDNDPAKIRNLTGVNDPFEVPPSPDLVIETDVLSIEESAAKLVAFIEENRSIEQNPLH
jgi:adenylylsulfate kinase